MFLPGTFPQPFHPSSFETEGVTKHQEGSFLNFQRKGMFTACSVIPFFLSKLSVYIRKT